MKKNTLYYIITALVILNLFTLLRLNILRKNIENRFQQLDLANNVLRSDMNNFYTNVDTMLKKQASILDNHNVTLGELNPSNYTIPVNLSITPKEYSEGLTATLFLNDKSIPMKKEGTSFTVTSEAYIFDDLHIKVVLEQNGVKKTETIDDYYDLKGKYLLGINGGYEGQASYGSGQYQYNGKIKLDFAFHENSPAVEKVILIKDINGGIIEKQEITPSNNVSVDVKGNVKLTSGDKFTIYAAVEDRYGLNYKYILLVFEANSKGESSKDITKIEEHNIVEISDKNGKILYAPKNDLGK